MARQILDLETLLLIPAVQPFTGLDVSPAGDRVVFSWNPTGRWELYQAALDGSTPNEKLSDGPGARFAPRFSPDGRRLVYALDLDGSERYDVWLHDLATGRGRSLTPDTPDTIHPSLSWSPDGRSVALISDHEGQFSPYALPADGGPPQRVAHLPYPAMQVSWSPDGRWLAVEAETSGQDAALFLVPSTGGEPISVTDGRQHFPARDACWSPDGARLAFASNLHGTYQIGLFELASSQVRWLTASDGANETPAWSPDGRRIAYVHRQGPQTSLTVIDLAREETSQYSLGPGIHYAPRFTPDGTRLVFAFDSPCHPADLWLLALDDGSACQLTHSLPGGLTPDRFVMPQETTYPGLDGVSVPALLYRPAAAPPTPAVVYVHGGPNWLSQMTWDPLVQHLVSRGWLVLAPNYRGSTGYGRAWQLASRFDLGGVDTDDVVAGADYLVRAGLADPARIAVTGRSWGGYLTMTCLTSHPDRWAAGSAVVPFLNWFTGHANSRHDLQHWDIENMGDPQANHDLWYQRSPFFFLDRVQAPVQLVCGAHDPRCPASESQQAHGQLVALGKRCDLVLYPDEGHAFLKIENVIDARLRQVAFLAQALERE